MQSSPKKPAAQVAVAKNAAAMKAAAPAVKLPAELIAANQRAQAKAAQAADIGHDQHCRRHVHAARAPPVCLLDKKDIVAITGVSFPTIWAWMRAGRFPRSRVVGGKSMWLSAEIEQWLANLPVRPLKGDAPSPSEAA
jgi:predicted DNA-binding transcriptional regulator AlpA